MMGPSHLGSLGQGDEMHVPVVGTTMDGQSLSLLPSNYAASASDSTTARADARDAPPPRKSTPPSR